MSIGGLDACLTYCKNEANSAYSTGFSITGISTIFSTTLGTSTIFSMNTGGRVAYHIVIPAHAPEETNATAPKASAAEKVLIDIDV